MDTIALHKELQFRSSRSSGSGGQHVNKVETRIELLFEPECSKVLNDKEKARVKEALQNRINKDGVLIIAADNHRSQLRNKKATVNKFDELIRKALRPRKKRKKAKSFKANPKKRLDNKKRQSEKKALRGKIQF